ncbi:DNRLRE domain-containing protein [Paenibacillus sp. FSL R5-0810]|uniref:DNRLRE domain-containing protein n=1 Tax=Paenibacillus sp. FSL R5-0810 TaxID=2921659 RepID=UPI004046F39F
MREVTADTNIRSSFPKQTGATDTTLGVGLYKDAISSNIIRSLIQFDTSSIPQGANVLTADLNLWLASVSNDTDINVTLHAITKPWTEYSASWMLMLQIFGQNREETTLLRRCPQHLLDQ